MSLAALHLSLPAISSEGPTFTVNTAPVVLVSILDHHLRRDDPASDQVIGTLLGYRGEDGRILEITNSYPVSVEVDDEEGVSIDVDYHRSMFDLHQRVNSREVILGWYSTGSGLSKYASAIHDFYAREALPTPAIHLTVDTGLVSGSLSVQAYTASRVGFNTSGESTDFVFVPLPGTIKASAAERPALDLLHRSPTEAVPVTSDLALLEGAIRHLQETIARVSTYVDSVLSGATEANAAVGRCLLDAVTAVPKLDATSFETAFNSHLQDLLMVNYLADITRAQLAISQNLLTLA